MIFDQLVNWRKYPFGKGWEQAFNFLESLSPDSHLGAYEISGNQIFAQIAQYETMPVGSKPFEAHRNYIDVQVVLSGLERMDVSPLEGLTLQKPYHEDQDVEFFEPTQAPVSMSVSPGFFAVFFPQDAHIPGLWTGEQLNTVKKVVVKISRSCLA